MTIDILAQIIVAGVLGTYVHLLIALWAPCLGLPRLDFPAWLANLTFGDSFEGKAPYSLGLIALHMNGIFFAFLYATAVGPLLPGPDLVKGLIYGGLLFFGSQCVFVPFFMKDGFFGSKVPGPTYLSAILVHGVFGLMYGWLCPIIY